MAFFLPRKILSISKNSINTNLLDPVCDYDCSESNVSGLCESSCLKICSQFCKQSFEDYLKTPPPPISHHQFLQIKKISIISISALAIFFVIACFLIVYLDHKRRSVSRSREQRRGNVNAFLDEGRGPVVDHPVWYIRTVGLHSSVIGSIPVYRYKKGEGLVEETECSVCLSQFEEDETLRLLPKCNHAFHVDCIDTWLQSHTNCPLCRAPVVTDPYASFSSPGLSIRVLPEETLSGIQQENQESENVIRETEEELSGEADGIQQVRRSVSMDSLSASKISQAVLDRNHSDIGPAGMEEPNRQGSSSIEGGSVQNEPPFLNRSISCSAKFMIPK